MKNRGIFIARRGALLATPERGYLEHPSEVDFQPNLMPLLRFFSRPPYYLYLVGNETEVATGKLTEERMEAIQTDIVAKLAMHGVTVTRNFYSTIDPESPGFDGKDSVFRMPNVGAFKAAQQEQDLDLEGSWLIAERTSQVLAADRAGCRTALVLTGVGGRDGEFEIEPELIADDAATALRIIQMEEQRVFH